MLLKTLQLHLQRIQDRCWINSTSLVGPGLVFPSTCLTRYLRSCLVPGVAFVNFCYYLLLLTWDGLTFPQHCSAPYSSCFVRNIPKSLIVRTPPLLILLKTLQLHLQRIQDRCWIHPTSWLVFPYTCLTRFSRSCLVANVVSTLVNCLYCLLLLTWDGSKPTTFKSVQTLLQLLNT